MFYLISVTAFIKISYQVIILSALVVLVLISLIIIALPAPPCWWLCLFPTVSVCVHVLHFVFYFEGSCSCVLYDFPLPALVLVPPLLITFICAALACCPSFFVSLLQITAVGGCACFSSCAFCVFDYFRL